MGSQAGDDPIKLHRQQLASLDMFEEYSRPLLAPLSRNRLTIDLQKLFFSMTLDSATEFLFGQSVGAQGAGHGSEASPNCVQPFLWPTQMEISMGMVHRNYRRDMSYNPMVCIYVQVNVKHQWLVRPTNLERIYDKMCRAHHG
jgi:hypothetical protein